MTYASHYYDNWIAACSDYRWFSGKDSGKSESFYNEWANTEAAKFDKVKIIFLFHEYIYDSFYQISILTISLTQYSDSNIFLM